MSIKSAKRNTDYQYTVSYSDMGGVNFTQGSTVDRRHFAYLENMYRDYGDGAVLESIPGFRRIAITGEMIHSLFHQKAKGGADYVIIHAGKSLYRFSVNSRDSISGLTPIATVKDAKSSAFSVGESIYILDGEKITVIDGYGRVGTLGDDSNPAFVPTTYVNGRPHQAMNLLSDEFCESFLVGCGDEICYGTKAVRYLITDTENRLCSAVGINSSHTGGIVQIPSYIDIGGEKYRVTEIGDCAFAYKNNINAVLISEGILKIGRAAFYGCTALTDVQTPSTLVEIDDEAFRGCSALSTFYLSGGVRRIGGDAFTYCDALKTIKYASSTTNFAKIEGTSALSSKGVEPQTKSEVTKIRIPIYTPAAKITQVTVDGVVRSTYSTERTDGLYTAIILTGDGIGCFDGIRVEIHGTIDEEFVQFSSENMGLISPTYSGNGRDAIYGCTVCECFDGRIFLSGNPDLPNTVIYSEKDDTGIASPYYFGIYNYFNDGISSHPVKSMLNVGDSLAVFKAEDDGSGAIFYHTAASSGVDILPRIYPTTYVHNGTGARGESISFYDDPIFISKEGVMSLASRAINLERSIVCRSRNVNARLCKEDLDSASLAIWRGYLCVLLGEHIYLADSRKTVRDETGEIGYEWYYLSEIGTYTQDSRVFRYSSKITKAGYEVHENEDGRVPADAAINIDTGTSTGYIYYVVEGGKKYEVYPTLESRGGIFNPATTLLSIDEELLFFGCSNGDVCIFNNDKRGVAPPSLTNDPDFDYEDYEKVYGDKIHPYYYDFNTHAAKYRIKTPIDNCDIPNMTKSTVKHSLTVKCRIGGVGGGLNLEVGTDRTGYREQAFIPNAVIDFSDIDFSSMALTGYGDITLPIAEREKGWIEKQITLSLDGYMTPFTLHSLSYRFKIKGRVKAER